MRWADKSVIGQFSISRRGQMRAGVHSRYSGLKWDTEHAIEFGFVDSDDEGKTSQKFEITSQHLEDNASICSSMPQSDHHPPSRHKIAEDGVVYESIVVNNEVDEAASMQKKAELAELASKQRQLDHNKQVFDKVMKSKRLQKGVLKGKVKTKKIMEREECIEEEVFCKSNLVQLSS